MQSTKHNHSFVKNGRNVMPSRDRGNETPAIPAGVYMVKYNPDIGFYLTEQEPLSLPSKLYGTTKERSDMILNTFVTRQGKNTGVLLTGNKGSGKTMLTKQVCMTAIEQLDMPVLLIESALAGGGFMEFMNSIMQPCVVLIDEFEKKYAREEEQNALLSLLDGTGTNNKLFLLTSNSEQVSQFLLSRPSRLFYHWRYGKLEEEVLVGFCKDNLKDEKHIANITTLWGISSDMSFDVLQSLVEELNRYPEKDFVDLICNMNVSLGDALRRSYIAQSATWGGVELPLMGSGQNATVNVIDLQEGKVPMCSSVIMDKWEDQLAVVEALTLKECYFYNTGLFHSLSEEAGDERITLEEAQNRMDKEISLNLTFTQGLDRVRGDSIIFSRMVGGKELVVEWKVSKKNTTLDYFRRLFD